METQEILGEDAMELEGSATAGVPVNISAHNFTTITVFTYYQHSLYVATCYILAYFFIFLLCMVGNILVCLIVLENRRMRTVTNLFILNLAISDLLVGIFCIPTTLVDNLITGWPFSNIMCKMSGFVQGVSVSASVYTLVAIAVERFRCIVYPLKPKPTALVAKAAIVLIWLLAVVIMCPAAMALTLEEFPHHYIVNADGDFNHTLPVYSCYENFENPQMRKIYTALLFALIYLVPLGVITLMYASIGVKLCSTVVGHREPQMDVADQGPRRRGGQPLISQRKSKVIKMLTLVALLFMLSWLPLWTLMMMADYAGLDRDQLDLLTSYIFPFSHWLAFSNSSINPIIYGYYNENFRRGFQAIWKSKPFCCLVRCQRLKKLTLWNRRRERSVVDIRGATNNPNHMRLGQRNRLRDDNQVNVLEEVNSHSRAGGAVVHTERVLSNQRLEMSHLPKKSSNEESDKVSSLAVSVYHTWECHNAALTNTRRSHNTSQ